MSDDDESGNIICVDFGQPKDEDGDPKPSIQAPNRSELLQCAHGSIVVDVANRAILCDSCKAILDPFEVLKAESYKQSHHWNWTQELKKDFRKKSEELLEVKRQLKNAKAALQRARRKF
jgi:hypothetical protein